MVFVRKKSVNKKEYYYLVKSVRDGKNIERYVGLNPPTRKEISLFEKEYDSTKTFLALKDEEIDKIKHLYKTKTRKASKDELAKLEEFMITSMTYNTSRIEGSTLSMKDTNLLLNQGIVPGNKPYRDVKEVENHKKAYLFSKSYRKDIDKDLILSLYKLLKEGVSEDAGTFRTAQVRVGDMIGLNPKLIETEMDNLLGWYDTNKKKLHPLQLVSEFHCTFERIHPFFDGNGRVGRLLMNHTLARKGYPPIIIQNRFKVRYYNALTKGQKGNYLYMVKYLFSELKSLKEMFK